MRNWWSNLEPEARWIISALIIIVILVVGAMGALKWQDQKASDSQFTAPITEPAPADEEDSSADIINDDQGPSDKPAGSTMIQG